MGIETFPIVRLLWTRTVEQSTINNPIFAHEVLACLERYRAMDWGETDKDDCRLNDKAVQLKNDRVLARYVTSLGDIFINTEWESGNTVIMFASEY